MRFFFYVPGKLRVAFDTYKSEYLLFDVMEDGSIKHLFKLGRN